MVSYNSIAYERIKFLLFFNSIRYSLCLANVMQILLKLKNYATYSARQSDVLFGTSTIGIRRCNNAIKRALHGSRVSVLPVSTVIAYR